MPRPAIFFDRDNTLIITDGYLGDPEQVVLVDGAAEAVARARQLGFAVVVFSNQSGVARGMFTEDDVRAVNQRMNEMLRAQHPDAIVDHHEYCPYHPEAVVEQYRRESELRKPMPGMILRAAKALDLDLSSSWVIGDAPRDVQAGHAAGCRTILVNDPSFAPSPAAAERPAVQPDFTVTTLAGAMATVEQNRGNSLPPAAARPSTASSTGASSAPAPAADLRRLESLSEQILAELRRSREQPEAEFSVSRLLAGIVQVLALAALLFSYLHRDQPTLLPLLLLAAVLQTLTITLLIMGMQRA